MFILFYNLYYAMFRGTWMAYTIGDIPNHIKSAINGLGTFLTSIFNDGATMDTLGDTIFNSNIVGYIPYLGIVSFILALITSIGIVVMAVKGIKHIFTIFFEGLR